MARSEFLRRSRFYGNWDPYTHPYVWEDNDARAERLARLEYARKHPKQVKLDSLIELHEEMLRLWNQERETFQRKWRELIEEYRRTIEVIDEQDEEIKRLNSMIIDLNARVEDAYERQRQINRRLQQIQNEKELNAERALEYRNEAVAAFNAVADDIYFRKFAAEDIEYLRYLLQRMDNTNLEDGAIQGLAVQVLAKLDATQKIVTRKQIEFELILSIARDKAYALRDQYLMWRDEVYFDEEKKNHADMDYWSRHLFSEQMQNVEIICHNVDVAPQSMDIMTEDLRRFQDDMDELQMQGEETVTHVLDASAQSERAEALAQRTAIILAEDFYFRTVYMGFNDDDERSAYVVQLENVASGIRMQFIFSPLSPTQVGCNYSVSFSGYQDEKRVNAIMNSLWSELMPNKISPSARETRERIVDSIDFVPSGVAIHLPEYAIAQQ